MVRPGLLAQQARKVLKARKAIRDWVDLKVTSDLWDPQAPMARLVPPARKGHLVCPAHRVLRGRKVFKEPRVPKVTSVLKAIRA